MGKGKADSEEKVTGKISSIIEFNTADVWNTTSSAELGSGMRDYNGSNRAEEFTSHTAAKGLIANERLGRRRIHGK